MDVFKHYSGKEIPECACCGETEYSFLTIDHINPCGKDRESRTGYYIYRYLRKNKYPEGYQILCYKCNHAKAGFKVKFCPDHHPELYPEFKEKYVKPENKCEVCGQPMPLEEWLKSGLQRKTCNQKCNRERLNRLTILRHRYYREECFKHYGTKCACCGSTDYYGLTIDHLTRVKWHNKNEKRRRSGAALYRWLVVHKFPEGYQALCASCNQEKRFTDKPLCKIHHPEIYP